MDSSHQWALKGHKLGISNGWGTKIEQRSIIHRDERKDKSRKETKIKKKKEFAVATRGGRWAILKQKKKENRGGYKRKRFA